jgi:signal transduction histidine kinase
MQEFTSLNVTDLTGVFTARQVARALAAELGLETQDQVRVATALSEITRSTVNVGRSAVVGFAANGANLVLTIKVDGEPPEDGVAAAARLMDRVTVTDKLAEMTKRRPTDAKVDARAVRRHLAAVLPQSSMDELRRNNQDLIAALEDLRQQKEQLLLLNSELQETNRGVVALYTELSEELEQTNRGVVALYAELDDKSEQLRAVSAAKDRFWANISHELRTPLNSIIGLTKLLADPGGDGTDLGTEQLYQVGLIANSTSTLLTLVNDLLDVAKAESGRLTLDPAHVNVPDLLLRLDGLSSPIAEGKPVNVVMSDEGAPATVLTDESALTAILRNLMSNGIKYTDSGEVRLTARAVGSDLEVSVVDTGVGIPAIHQARVFEEFYQVPGVRKGGTGLGLPYARRLAEILGGSLTLTSEPGSGTTVVLRLPSGVAAVGTVLIADDDAGFRQHVRGMLAGIADQVVEAADGRQALEIIAASKPDLVLTDMRMPDIDGSALLMRLPEGTPALVITGLDIQVPDRAAGLLHKDELTAERLAFAISRITGAPHD